MALPATDNFNRADENPIAGNWTNHGTQNRIVSNVVQGNNWETASNWNADTFNNDQYAKYTIVSSNGTMDAGVAVRIGPTSLNCYIMSSYGGGCGYGKFVNNAFSDIIGTTTTTAPGDIIELRISGSTLSGFKNGSPVSNTASDGTLTSGSAGFYIYDANAQIDNWEGGNIGGGAPVLPPNSLMLAGVGV
jgi:hypothetical protein